MTMTDPISDFLTRLRNALKSRHETVDIPISKMKVDVARIMKEEGFIDNFKAIEDKTQGTLRLYLKYGPENENIINGLKRVSRPGRRVYIGGDEIPYVMGGYGINIISTSKGIITGKEAKRQNIGGEIICEVW
jgi:small subunit ribosomal protein S8